MERNDMTNEVESMGMNTAEAELQTFIGTLEALEIIAEMETDHKKIAEAIRRVKDKIKEPTSGTK